MSAHTSSVGTVTAHGRPHAPSSHPPAGSTVQRAKARRPQRASSGHATPFPRAPRKQIGGTRLGSPAVEQRGEGVFLQLHEDVVQRWEASVAEHPRLVALQEAYGRSRESRDQIPDPRFPVARYTLLHTLSHLLIRQAALECGYSSAGIRERLSPGRPDERTAGILLTTAASDSEGTLGGLVALGEARHLRRLLDPRLRRRGALFVRPALRRTRATRPFGLLAPRRLPRLRLRVRDVV